ncbi:MAG: hypothetical protein K9H41_04960 [Bacteroidia bacterium]|nr:hypothetical protein [Bacteroidia bacterium]
MKTSKKISKINSKNKILLIFASLAFIVFASSILFHVTPLKLITDISDFAVHHYFISGFIAIVLFAICVKQYFFNTDIVNELRSEKKLRHDLKIKKRKLRVQNFRNNLNLKLEVLKRKIYTKNNISVSK